MFRSAHAIGALPQSLGPAETVDWLPVDVVGKVLVEILEKSRAQDDEKAVVYHVVNPHKMTFAKLIPPIAKQLGLSLIPFATWVDNLAALGQDGSTMTATLDRAPALKLLDFFKTLVETDRSGKALVALDTTQAEEASAMLKAAGPVTGAWLSNWIRQWGL